MPSTSTLAAVTGAIVLAAGALVAGGTIADVTPNETTTVAEAMGCEDWNVQLTAGECFAAGIIRFVGFHNLQGAGQFCKWQPANPGEWSRLQGYAETETAPTSIVSWFGGSIRNWLEAYFATGAPTFVIQPNTAVNRCKTPLAPPVVTGVTPGETDATVTIAP